MGGSRAEKRLCGLCVSLAAQQVQVLHRGTEMDLDTCLPRQKKTQQHKKPKNAARLEYDSAWHNRSADSGRDPHLFFSSRSQTQLAGRFHHPRNTNLSNKKYKGAVPSSRPCQVRFFSVLQNKPHYVSRCLFCSGSNCLSCFCWVFFWWSWAR